MDDDITIVKKLEKYICTGKKQLLCLNLYTMYKIYKIQLSFYDLIVWHVYSMLMDM